MSVREGLIAAIAFLAVLAIIYANVIFDGKSLVYSDAPGSTEQPIERYQSPRFVQFATWDRRNLLYTPNFHDPGISWWMWEPGGEFFRKGLLRGELPFWNPYIGCGTPEMSNLNDAVFFPPYVLLILLGNTDLLRNLYYLGLQFSAAFFMYLFLRKHSLSKASSLFGGFACMLAGGLVQNIGSMIGQTSACLPLSLFLTKRFFDRPSWKRAAVLSIGYGSIALASFPPGLIAVFGFTAAYAAAMLASIFLEKNPPRVSAFARRYLAAILLAGGLVAFYYVPTFKLMQFASQSTQIYNAAALIHWPPVYSLQLLSPTLMGGSMVLRGDPMPGFQGSKISYVGIVVLLFAFLARPEPQARRGPLFLVTLISSVFILLKLIGAPPAQWISSFPILRYVHFVHFSFLLDYGLVILAALGFEALLSGRIKLGRSIFACAAIALLVFALYVIARSAGVFHDKNVVQWTYRWDRVVALTVCLILLVLFGRQFPRVQKTGILLLLVLEGFFNTAYPRPERWDVWRHPLPYETTLARESTRARVLVCAELNANTNEAFDIYSLDSLMTFNSPRLFRAYNRYLRSQVEILMRAATQVPPDGFLESANIGYVLVNKGVPDFLQSARERRFPEVMETPWVKIFRRSVAPRYFFTRSYRVATPEAALNSLGTQDSVVPLSLETAPGFATSGGDEIRPVVPTQLRRNSVSLSVDAPGPGLVYCSESNMPGWTARGNGRSEKINAPNYACRAIEVPEGHSQIELSYWPPGLTAGLLVSLVSVAILIGAATRPAGAQDDLPIEQLDRDSPGSGSPA